MIPEITPIELREALDGGEMIVLLDVREDDEISVSHLDGILHIPMGEIPDRLDEVPTDLPVAVICRSGGRSGRITEYLISQGYSNVKNMVGGMKGYAAALDPSMPVA